MDSRFRGNDILKNTTRLCGQGSQYRSFPHLVLFKPKVLGDSRSGEAAAHEAVVNYREWDATKKIKGDSPLFYTLIILALKKVKDGKENKEKRGLSPFIFSRRVKNADL
jgi:hypothetical protein